QHQNRARRERNPPSKREKLLVRQPLGKRQKYHSRKEKPDWRTKLWEHPVPCAPSGRRILNRQQHRAAPFPSKAEPLAESAQREQKRRDNANRSVSRQNADAEGGNTHGQQRRHQRGFPADAISKVAEQSRPDWPCQKRDRKRCQRCQHRGSRIRPWEK